MSLGSETRAAICSKVGVLRDRAAMLAQARAFFADLNVLEVDCPILGHAAPIDLHIDVMEVSLGNGQTGYLHTSAEYGLKRLLAMGTSDLYQLSHVFRQAESGPLHNPEFTMVEWYRTGLTFDQLIEETLAFIRLFLPPLPAQILTYREAFKTYAQFDYLPLTQVDLLALAEKNNLQLSPGVKLGDRDSLLQLLMSLLVEPQLGSKQLSVIADFPATQAALAQTTFNGAEPIAKRFEVYYRGIELANGYHELTDAAEQRRRLTDANARRQHCGKPALKIDENFLQALEQGLPDCCGVAVGFDRLMMLRHQASTLEEVLPFT